MEKGEDRGIGERKEKNVKKKSLTNWEREGREESSLESVLHQ